MRTSTRSRFPSRSVNDIELEKQLTETVPSSFVPSAPCGFLSSLPLQLNKEEFEDDYVLMMFKTEFISLLDLHDSPHCVTDVTVILLL